MIRAIKTWWAKRRIDRAQAVIESYGLTIVKMQMVAGTAYIQHADGKLLKLVKVPRSTGKVTPFDKAKAA